MSRRWDRQGEQMDEPKKMRRKKKILIGLGIYVVVAVIASVIAVNSESAKTTAKEEEAEAAAELAEMDAIYESHDPETFRRYALDAAKKQERIVVTSVQPDVYSCIVDVEIGGYVYSFTDDGADADSAVAAACLYALDCAEEVFSDEHIENIFFHFHVKNKLDSLLYDFVWLVVGREHFVKIEYEDFRHEVKNNYNAMWKICGLLGFSSDVENRLKKFDKKSASGIMRR